MLSPFVVKAASRGSAQILGKREMSYSRNSLTVCSQSWEMWSDLGKESQTMCSTSLEHTVCTLHFPWDFPEGNGLVSAAPAPKWHKTCHLLAGHQAQGVHSSGCAEVLPWL